jgi:hypothetical protein
VRDPDPGRVARLGPPEHQLDGTGATAGPTGALGNAEGHRLGRPHWIRSCA